MINILPEKNMVPRPRRMSAPKMHLFKVNPKSPSLSLCGCLNCSSSASSSSSSSRWYKGVRTETFLFLNPSPSVTFSSCVHSVRKERHFMLLQCIHSPTKLLGTSVSLLTDVILISQSRGSRELFILLAERPCLCKKVRGDLNWKESRKRSSLVVALHLMVQCFVYSEMHFCSPQS